VLEDDRGCVNVRYGYVCQQGEYPKKPDWVCQDACVALDKFEDTFGHPRLFFGVFDGHGNVGEGDRVSRALVEKLPARLQSEQAVDEHQSHSSHMFSAENPAFTRAFRAMNKAILAEMGPRANTAGSTAVVLVVSTTMVQVGHVGDSRAVVAKDRGGEHWEAVQLTRDHTPHREDERLRILKDFKAAEISTFDAKTGRVSFDGMSDMLKNSNPDDPFRVYVKGTSAPGLCVSRSIGDGIAKRIGVTADPETRQYNLHPTDKALVVFSDGVHAYMTNEEVVAMVENHTDPREAAEEIVQEAFQRWTRNETRVDDISVIVAYLRKTPRRKSTVRHDH